MLVDVREILAAGFTRRFGLIGHLLRILFPACRADLVISFSGFHERIAAGSANSRDLLVAFLLGRRAFVAEHVHGIVLLEWISAFGAMRLTPAGSSTFSSLFGSDVTGLTRALRTTIAGSVIAGRRKDRSAQAAWSGFDRRVFLHALQLTTAVHRANTNSFVPVGVWLATCSTGAFHQRLRTVFGALTGWACFTISLMLVFRRERLFAEFADFHLDLLAQCNALGGRLGFGLRRRSSNVSVRWCGHRVEWWW